MVVSRVQFGLWIRTFEQGDMIQTVTHTNALPICLQYGKRLTTDGQSSVLVMNILRAFEIRRFGLVDAWPSTLES